MKENIKLNITKNIKLIPIIALVLIIVFAFYYYIGCPIRFLTGLPCPGCGMRHAAYYLITGNINEAIRWHPLIFAMPIAILILIFHKKFSKISLTFFLVFFVTLFIGVYIYRFLDPTDIVVRYDFSQTIYHRLWGL